MPDIENHTLVIAIQAVAWEIRSLREVVASGEAGLDDYQLLDDWLHAAEDLERAYDVEAKTLANLPPYRELVGA